MNNNERERLNRLWLHRRAARKKPGHPGVCDRWYESFDDFIADIIQLPGWDDLTLVPDRINTFGPYEPGNIRFVPTHINQRNRKDKRTIVDVDGTELEMMAFIEKYTGARIAKDNPKAYNFTKARLTEGWDTQRILDALHSGEYLERRPSRPNKSLCLGHKDGVYLFVNGKHIHMMEFLNCEIRCKAKRECPKAYSWIRSRKIFDHWTDERIVTEFRKKFKTSI